MNKFKIGDRVHNEEKGFGTIININSEFPSVVCVEYDNEIEYGHDGFSGPGNIKGKNGYCWWENNKTIEKVEDEGRKQNE